jgi:molybdate transport system ATP-binding protein
MIELKHVTIVRNRKRLFHDLSFQFADGEHWVIQGHNGAGKTLLMQLIAGAVHPVEGQVSYSFIQAEDWDSLYQQRLEKIHFIPTHWLQAFLSGHSGLFYQQRYYSIDDSMLPKVRDIFGDAISALEAFTFSPAFDISPLLDLPVTRLSNGQLKKVIILRQLIKNIPRVLLFDYPYDGLDVESRHDLNNFLDELAIRFGIQIIIADHGEVLPRVINRKLVLRNFKVAEAVIVTDIDPPPALPKAGDTHRYGEPVVEMQDLTVAYNGKKIISNLNWRINKGERWALTGKNGSGKTTLFSLIYADHPMAYSQRVFLFGKRRGSGESIWDIKKRINYFGPEQVHFLDPQLKSLSAKDFINARGHTNIAQLPDVINFFDARHYIDIPMKTLSSGQLQMVLLINMFLDDRELLLLDEPFQFVDPTNHEKVNRYLHHYLNKNTTLVMITHDEKDVAQWTQLRKHLTA